MSAPAQEIKMAAASTAVSNTESSSNSNGQFAVPRVIKDPNGSKIITKINKAIAEKRVFYSFEYFPPKTDEGVLNLYERIDRMSELEPMFIDVTWGAGGSTADLTLEISSNAQNYCTPEVMMHLTCTNMDKQKIIDALNKARKAGIRNILALRGDPPKGVDTWEQCDMGFSHAVDLVRFIRKEHGDYFGIAVAGYPEAHTSAKSLDDDIKFLKEKLEAGADFVITQMFYDVGVFADYVKKCRAAGITAPIIPGIMPIQTYAGFMKMTGFCKTCIPNDILEALEPIKDDDAKVKAYGVELGIQMCQKLLELGVAGLHYYTLNLEKSVVQVLEGLGYIALTEKQQSSKKNLPWQPAKVSRRQNEEVRPIFWHHRPQSYLSRTATWDEFPNGRWGDARSPAFGDLSDYHLCNFRTGKPEERRTLWGENINSIADVHKVFENYIGGNIARLPWCENAVQAETVPLKAKLMKINHAGFLTINSQPRVNGAASDDPTVGWGGPGGYVFQKAYLEFFTSPENLQKLLKNFEKFPSLSYHAVNVKGESFTNITTKGVNAVTWGVFPAKEIIQPTVVDPKSFVVWKDEAFALWKSQWASIYPENSPSRHVIQQIHDNFYLVNVVDNDFVKGDIFAVFEPLE